MQEPGSRKSNSVSDLDHSNFETDFGSRFRASRGTMEPAILQTLLKKPMHGYEIITQFEEQSHGLWRPSPGSIYPTLQLLEEKGQVLSREDNGKKVYSLTDTGEKAAKKTNEIFACDQHERMKLFQDVADLQDDLSKAVRLIRNIIRVGDKAQKQDLKKLLASFSDSLKEIRTLEKG